MKLLKKQWEKAEESLLLDQKNDVELVFKLLFELTPSAPLIKVLSGFVLRGTMNLK